MIEEMGGNCSNTAYVLARLGVPARPMGLVGRESRGDAILAKLAAAGADISRIGRSSEPTTTTICVANSEGNRLFFQQVGASREAFSEPVDFTPLLCEGHSHYHQANLYSLPHLRRNPAEPMRRAKAAGLSVSVDTGWATDGRWMEVLEPALEFTDVLFVNEEESRMLTGETRPERVAASLRRHGARDIVLKLGARGCMVFTGGEGLRVPGFVVKAVDTTGAGDCFGAGFLASLHRGYAYPEAARIANAVGALAVQALGATRGILGWDETLAWMARSQRAGW
jgi:sugar/nucleoside kinase (ribokinase family)